MERAAKRHKDATAIDEDLVSSICMSGWRRWLRKILALSLGFVVAMIFAEVFLRVAGVVRNVGPSYTVYDAHLGKRLKRNFSCLRHTPEFSIQVSTNSLGFRGPEPKGNEEGGIVFIGDSFTMGHGVSDGEEYPALVFRMLSEHLDGGVIPVVNMGMGDNGNGRWIKLLREEVAQFKPRLVVLQVCGNDFRDNTNERLFRLNGNEQLQELPIPARSWKRRVQSMIEFLPGVAYSHVFCLVKQVVSKSGGGGQKASDTHNEQVASDEPTPAEKLTRALIRRSVEICHSQGWPIVILVVEDGWNGQTFDFLARDPSLHLVTIPSKKERPDIYFLNDGHWNSTGHEYVGNLMVEVIAGLPQFRM